MGQYRKDSKNGKKYRNYNIEKNKNLIQIKKINSIKKLISEKKFSRALNELDDFLREDPNNPFALFQHANVLFFLEEYDLAKDEFQNIVDQELENKNGSLYKLGLIELRKGNYDAAKSYFLNNIKESPYNETFSVLELSKLELERGNIDASINILYEYSNFDEDRMLLQLAMVLKLNNESKKAYDLVNGHRFIDDEYVIRKSHLTKAILEVDLSMQDKAMKSFAIVLNGPKDKLYYKALVEYAQANFKTKNYDNAINSCTEVINNGNSKQICKAMIIMGNIYKALNQYYLAERYYKECLNYNYTIDQKGYICLGTLMISERKYDEARIYINKYIETALIPKTKNDGYLKLALIDMKDNKINSCKDNLNKVNKDLLEGYNLDDYRCLNNFLKYNQGSKLDMTYTMEQMRDYSYDRLIKHIDKKHINDNGVEATFSENIDLNELILQLPTIFEKARLVDNRYYEYYEVEYKKIGKLGDNNVNTLRLVVFPNSKKVLTMFPVEDLIYQKELIQSQKQKTKSQIDKFNQKYGKRDN